MIRIHNAAFAVIAAACLAVPAVAQDRSPVTASIRYADLNLATPAGQAALKARIRSAAASMCPAMEGPLDQKIDAMRCRQEMTKDGAVQIARLTAPADQRLALADSRR
jgi:UrcA family protein